MASVHLNRVMHSNRTMKTNEMCEVQSVLLSFGVRATSELLQCCMETSLSVPAIERGSAEQQRCCRVSLQPLIARIIRWLG